jgi:hypothetical protein
MPHLPEDTNSKSWHRYFAMDANNLAWQLAVQARTAEQDQDMLNAAHAAALHWGVAGTESHQMRAEMLLAEVHALLGFGRSALEYAEQIRNYFLCRETPDWEIAYVHTIHAHAASVAGETEKYRESYSAAQQAIAAIVDEEDRNVVLKTFNQLPSS